MSAQEKLVTLIQGLPEDTQFSELQKLIEKNILLFNRLHLQQFIIKNRPMIFLI